MNIGIFETQHFEGAYPMIRIMDTPGNRLTIFVNAETHRRFSDLFGSDMNRYTWIIQPAGMHNRQFVWQIYKTCKKENIALLFLNTVDANFMLYGWAAAFLPATKVILTLHDANSFLESSFSLRPRRLIRHIGKKVLAHFSYAFSTVSETVQHHIINSMGIKKKVFCIPGAVFEYNNHALITYDAAAPLHIVVPGSIDDRRRNYNNVFELLEYANKRSLPLVITLAGGPYAAYGNSMLHKFREYCSMHSNLVYYETPVLDQHIFDSAMNKAHFIWIPSAIKTVIADGIEEEYGLTKSSGNIFDAIKHARPLLVPDALTMPFALRSSVFAYTSIENLADFLSTIAAAPQLYSLSAAEALNNSKQYTAERMRERIKILL